MRHVPFLFLPKDELTIKKNHSKHILNTEPLWEEHQLAVYET